MCTFHGLPWPSLRYVIETLFLFTMIAAASCITNVHELRTSAREWWWFCFFTTGAGLTWTYRYARAAMGCVHANQRRDAYTALVHTVGGLVLNILAWTLASNSEGDDDAYYTMMVLLVLAPNYWPVVRQGLEP